MTDADFEILDAFADGVRVDPDALKRALAHAEGRDYFVDVLALRDAARQLDVVDTPRAAAPGPRRSRFRLAAAAAVLAATAGAGYAAGSRAFATAGSPASAVSTETVVDFSSPAPAPPAPTRVIKLQPGVNWTDQAGGH